MKVLFSFSTLKDHNHYFLMISVSKITFSHETWRLQRCFSRGVSGARRAGPLTYIAKGTDMLPRQRQE